VWRESLEQVVRRFLGFHSMVGSLFLGLYLHHARPGDRVNMEPKPEKIDPRTEPEGMDELQKEILKQLEILVAAEQEAEPKLYQSLCALARKWRVDPEEFRRRLVAARLPNSRASEIKCVLSHPESYRPFLAGGATWHDSLDKARALAKDQELSKVEAAAARLVALLYRRAIRQNPATAQVRQTAFEHPRGTFEITARHQELEPAIHG